MKIPLLDHGYLELIETWGRGKAGVLEAGIIEAARQSTQGSFRQWDGYSLCETCGAWQAQGLFVYEGDGKCDTELPSMGSDHGVHRWKEYPRGDEGLLRFLFSGKPQHATPFEFCGMVIEVQAPIAVFREWHRHRTQSYNEMSARYAPLPDLNYMPTPERCLIVAGENKQAGAVAGADKITHEAALSWLEDLLGAYIHCEMVYQSGLRRGIPKELARLCVPVGRYSRMRAQATLRSWLAFLTLRMDAAAQWEIRQFANAVGRLIEENFPRTWSLFAERL